jgi:hypothetical protein
MGRASLVQCRFNPFLERIYGFLPCLIDGRSACPLWGKMHGKNFLPHRMNVNFHAVNFFGHISAT